MVHNIFDAKCLQVYFTLSQDNFIFGDVISYYMWEMSFVFKNECMYVLDHYSYMRVSPGAFGTREHWQNIQEQGNMSLFSGTGE